MSDFAVVKTWPYEGYTLRQLKCQICGSNLFSREYIMEKSEYRWIRDVTETGGARSYIDLRPCEDLDKGV
jgi:hypothetical protein